MFFLFPTYKRKTYHRSFSPFIRLITSSKKIIGLKVAVREMWIILLNHTNILRVRI